MNKKVVDNSSTIVEVASGSHVIILNELKAKQLQEMYANKGLNLHVSKNRYHPKPVVFLMRKTLKSSISTKINLMYGFFAKTNALTVLA